MAAKDARLFTATRIVSCYVPRCAPWDGVRVPAEYNGYDKPDLTNPNLALATFLGHLLGILKDENSPVPEDCRMMEAILSTPLP